MQILHLLRPGAITEISGAVGGGKTECALRSISGLLSENPEARVAWIEEELTVYPCAFAQKGVDLARVLFIEAGKNALWSVLQILRSQTFAVVVFRARWTGAGERELRRLQLASEKADCALVLLNDIPLTGFSWPIAVQVLVERSKDGALDIQVRKQRGQKTRGQEWNPSQLTLNAG